MKFKNINTLTEKNQLSLDFLKALIKKGRNTLYVPDLLVPNRMYNHINDCYARFI